LIERLNRRVLEEATVTLRRTAGNNHVSRLLLSAGEEAA
jgi:hypothetical protein